MYVPFVIFRSAQLNDSSGNGWIYPRAILAFLQSKPDGVDFRKRRLVPVGHSFGGHAMYVASTSNLHHLCSTCPRLLFDQIQKDFDIHEYIMLDATVGPHNEAKVRLNQMLLFLIWNKRDTWPSRETALDNLANSPSHKNWHPDVLDLFVVRATLTLRCHA